MTLQEEVCQDFVITGLVVELFLDKNTGGIVCQDLVIIGLVVELVVSWFSCGCVSFLSACFMMCVCACVLMFRLLSSSVSYSSSSSSAACCTLHLLSARCIG